MAKVTAEVIRKLREETGAPVMRVKNLLTEIIGDLPADATHQALQAGEKKAKDILMKEGFEKAAKREGRETLQGKLFTYVHHTGKTVGIVELLCETDFVARNELFEATGRDMAMQAASMGDEKFEKQEFIKDTSKKMEDLIQELKAKTGENIKLGRVLRLRLGEK